MKTLSEIIQQNQGVILGKRTTDFIGGTIPFEVRLASGDWRPFAPVGERQYRPAVDFMACVTYSGLNSIEFQYKQQGNNEINFSDRFIAKDSGTTHQGNWLYKVADAIRAGVVLESDYPTPASITWDEYYQPIPAEIYARRVKFDIAYEWINKADIAHNLKHAPIQIIITNSYPNHAVLAVHQEGDTIYYFDSYEPFIKTINISDVYPDALKIVGNFRMNPFVKTLNDKGTIGVVVFADTMENYKFLCKQYNIDPKINPDGSVTTDINL